VDTTYSGYYFNSNFITTWSFTTGANDTGNFTDIGLYNRPGGTEIKMAIYSDNNGLPDQLLGETGVVTVTPYTFNIYSIQTPAPLQPNTVYHTAILCKVSTHTAASNNTNTKPLRYKSLNFTSNFPTVLTGTGGSTYKNVALYSIANNAVLPVELKSFLVNKAINEEYVKLEWITASEVQNRGWIIERSNNGTSWESIGWIEGNGYTSSDNKYDFIDKDPVQGLAFYRITQEDYDGTKTSSEIKTIFMDKREWNIYPNPTQNVLYIKGIESGEVTIYDVQGREVLKTGLDSDNSISLKSLEVGNYSVHVHYLQGLKTFQITKI